MQYIRVDIHSINNPNQIIRSEFFCANDDCILSQFENKIVQKLKLGSVDGYLTENGIISIIEADQWMKESYGVGWDLNEATICE